MSYVNGTSADFFWYTNTGTNQWELEAGDLTYGSSYIFEREFKPFMIDSGNAKIGLSTQDFNEFSTAIMGSSDTIICPPGDNTCYGQEMNCSVYGSELEDLVLTLQASGKQFIIPSDRLMV